jgi:hypothetical protein
VCSDFLLHFYNRVTISSGTRDSIVVVGFFFVWPRTLIDDKKTRSHVHLENGSIP